MTSGPPPMVASPIADLTYRNYEGPLRTRAVRWSIVALNTLRVAFRNTGFWVIAMLCFLIHFGYGAGLFLTTAVGRPVTYPLTFHNVLCNDISSALLMAVGLIVGSGSIASDNRANALLVYLSKPLTKSDYLLGKWVGVCSSIFLVAFVPGLLLYIFCAFSFASSGFLKQNHWLIFHLLLATLVPAILHGSLIIGISAWSKSSSVAGAIYAGIYFAAGTLVTLISLMFIQENPETARLIGDLSIGGLIDGLVQNIYHVNLTDNMHRDIFGIPFEIPPPSLKVILSISVALVVAAMAAARAKIRAVEVIQG